MNKIFLTCMVFLMASSFAYSAWEITDIQTDPETKNVNVVVNFSDGFQVVQTAILQYPGNLPVTQQEFYDIVLKDIITAEEEIVKTAVQRLADEQAEREVKKDMADEKVNNSKSGQFKLKNLKNTDL